MASHTRIVQEIYASFGRGDIPAIVDTFADDIEFRHIGGPEIPYAKERIGKVQAARFFGELADAVEISAFEPQQFVEQGSSVVAIGRWAGKARRSGRVFDAPWVMHWEFDGGRVSRYQGFDDTQSMARAFSAP